MEFCVSKLQLKLIGIVLLAATASAQMPAGDPVAGEKKATICAACHGPKGVSVNPDWPKQAGQHAQYMYKQLVEFKAGMTATGSAVFRKDPVMSAQASLLSEQDMADLSAYFATLPVSYADIAPADEELARRGERLYRGGDVVRHIPACSGCHSPSGLGNGPAKFPILAGQHSKYISNQLNHFRSGLRANDSNRMMRDIAERLSDADIAAVALYIQGLSN